MTVLYGSCKTARSAHTTKVVAEISEYPPNLKPVGLKVAKAARCCCGVTLLRQPLAELGVPWTKVRRSLRPPALEETRLVYLLRMTSLQKKKNLVFPISVSVTFSLGFTFWVDKHSSATTATPCLVLVWSHKNAWWALTFARIIPVGTLCSSKCHLHTGQGRCSKDRSETV